MKQFTLRRLFAAVTLIALGVAALALVLRTNTAVVGEDYIGNRLAFPLWIGGGSLIGAGIFMPFHKTWLGLIIGLLIQIAIAVAALSHMAGGLGGG